MICIEQLFYVLLSAYLSVCMNVRKYGSFTIVDDEDGTVVLCILSVYSERGSLFFHVVRRVPDAPTPSPTPAFNSTLRYPGPSYSPDADLPPQWAGTYPDSVHRCRFPVSLYWPSLARITARGRITFRGSASASFRDPVRRGLTIVRCFGTHAFDAKQIARVEAVTRLRSHARGATPDKNPPEYDEIAGYITTTAPKNYVGGMESTQQLRATISTT
jgi:hypothetical protein